MAAAGPRVVFLLIPICPSLTLLRNSLAHRSVRHLLFVEGSPQDRRCRPPGVSEAADRRRRNKREQVQKRPTFDLSAECPRYDYFKLGGWWWGALIHSPLDGGNSPRAIFPAIPDDRGSEQAGNGLRFQASG